MVQIGCQERMQVGGISEVKYFRRYPKLPATLHEKKHKDKQWKLNIVFKL